MNYALVFAGGVGSRMNSREKPKQFLEIHGKPIIVYTIEHFDRHPEIDCICVVIVEKWLLHMQHLVEKFNLKKVKWIVSGGINALDSQYKGLHEIRYSVEYEENSVVLIHDGVRPLINEKLISECINNTKEMGSAVTVAPAIETIIWSDEENFILDTFPRAECKLARAPQTFKLDTILNVHERARRDGKYDFVDSTSMMLYYGFKIYTVEGPVENIKVTNPSDFYICRALMDAKENLQIYGI